MPEGRPHIPEELKRRVLVEAGHRCAIPTCRATPLQIAHIVPWAKVKRHDFSNLIALCANCHDRNTRGEIKTKDLQLYKKLLSQGTDFQKLVDDRLRRLEAERNVGAGFGTGFSRSCAEYSNRAFPIGLLIGEKFFTLGVCVFVSGRTALVPHTVIEEIAQGRSEQGGEPAVFEHFGMCSYREVSTENDLVSIEVDLPDEYVREQMIGRLGDAFEEAKHLYTVDETKVKGQLIGYVGEYVGILANPRNTENLRPARGLQFQDAFVSFREPPGQLWKFWLTPIPSDINYSGSPVFRSDGTLLGLVTDFQFVEGEAGGRPVVSGLLGFPDLWKDEMERSHRNEPPDPD